MDKYALLTLFNTPFVIFGLVKSFLMHKSEKIGWIGLIVRIVLWMTAFFALVLAREIYAYLSSNSLTDTTPLSLADVVLTTGVLMCITTCIRLYGKVEDLEKRVSDLHEELSIKDSNI